MPPPAIINGEGMPISFAPLATIRMDITEKSDFRGDLHVALHGYKVLGGGAPNACGVGDERSIKQGRQHKHRSVEVQGRAQPELAGDDSAERPARDESHIECAVEQRGCARHPLGRNDLQ